MKNSKKIVAVLALSLSVLTLSAQKKGKMPKILNTNGTVAMNTPFEELKWYSPMDGAPIQFADASGKTFEGNHSTYGRFPGNFATPEHVHSHSYRAVVISGVMTNPMATDKGEPIKLTPGSFWYVPGGQPHVTACVSETPCVFYMYQDVAFDFTPTKK